MEYTTSHTPLAAYLMSEGFPNKEIKFVGYTNKAVFVFEKTPQLEKSVDDFNTVRAFGNIPVVFDIYRRLLIQVKGGGE